MKKLEWQHNNEKVLYFARENIFSYIIKNYNFIFLILWILIFIFFFVYFIEIKKTIFILILMFYVFFSFILFYFFWHKTYFIITNKRVMKYIRNWLFAEHTKELKIAQIGELTVSKKWIISKIFGFWNIKITWQDKECVIWVRWINYSHEVIQYISRLKDYILENPWYDYNKLNPFKLRKERKKNKN